MKGESGKEEERKEIVGNEICFKNKVLLGTSGIFFFFSLEEKVEIHEKRNNYLIKVGEKGEDRKWKGEWKKVKYKRRKRLENKRWIKNIYKKFTGYYRDC